MLKIVLDTNVLVSGLLKPDSTPELVLLLILNNLVKLFVSKDIYKEYQDVLSRGKWGKHLDPKAVQRILSQIKKGATFISPEVSVSAVKEDPADNKFLECALEAQADFFITGNIKHFPFPKFYVTRILSPADFINEISETIL